AFFKSTPASSTSLGNKFFKSITVFNSRLQNNSEVVLVLYENFETLLSSFNLSKSHCCNFSNSPPFVAVYQCNKKRVVKRCCPSNGINLLPDRLPYTKSRSLFGIFSSK